MKKLITTCVLLAVVTTVSFAQTRATKSAVKSSSAAAASTTKSSVSTTSPEQLAESHAKTMQAQYGLTAEQYKYIYSTDLDYYNQEKQAKANGGQIGEGQSSQMKIGRDQRYQNVMTPEQFAKYQTANQQTK